MIIVYKLIKEAFTQNMICTLLVVECFPPCFLWNVFLQVRFCKVFYRACGGISSHKACCGPVPTSLVGLAYNSKSCFLIMCITFLSLTFIQWGAEKISFKHIQTQMQIQHTIWPCSINSADEKIQNRRVIMDFQDISWRWLRLPENASYWTISHPIWEGLPK